ncbi:hypothetical protein DTO217A2_2601 [Paecilomyces variotii]|nr:hypothetical protein DTO217A2_2601 [Paecilomyces variotii]KAJ9373544.1 hypothetical protein DTO282E5_1699 [Paecilomyces variotii]
MGLIPEQHVIPPNKYALNSPFPVLIYRDALPLPLSEEKTTQFLEANEWEKRGVWGHIPVRHFHPNTHECYGVFQGESRLLLGCGQSDEDGGLEVDVYAGDVIVLPAGTAHCCLQSTKDYRYIGVYPKECPRWRNELGKDPLDVEGLRNEISSVPIPNHDPVLGKDGALVTLWKSS